eukprot:12918967-Prorocentrum_lima.AAC.1
MGHHNMLSLMTIKPRETTNKGTLGIWLKQWHVDVELRLQCVRGKGTGLATTSSTLRSWWT